MECAQCGTVNDDEAAFCEGCGLPLSAAEGQAEAGDSPRERGPARMFVEGASFVVAVASSVAAMLSYLLPWVELDVSGAMTDHLTMIWYWPLALVDASAVAMLVLLGFNSLPMIFAFSFAIMESLRFRARGSGAVFFHATLFMAVIFSFFVVGCLDFTGYMATPSGEFWFNSLMPGHGAVTVTAGAGRAVYLLAAAVVGYLISAALCGFDLWRRKELTVRAAGVSLALSVVACLGGYIGVWSILSYVL
jgi:hypothetical protein